MGRSIFDPPPCLNGKTNTAWRNAASASFENPKLLRSRYWKRYNTITIPIQPASDFYDDAIAAAWQSISRRELEDKLEALRKQRARELERLIFKMWTMVHDGNSGNIDEAAAEVLNSGSLASMLKMICGLLFGWDAEDTSPLLRNRERMAKRGINPYGNEDGHAGEHSDEDWDVYGDDDYYKVRECEDTEEELLRWRFYQYYGLGDENSTPPDCDFIKGRGWVPKDRKPHRDAESSAKQETTSKGPNEPAATATRAEDSANDPTEDTTNAAGSQASNVGIAAAAVASDSDSELWSDSDGPDLHPQSPPWRCHSNTVRKFTRSSKAEKKTGHIFVDPAAVDLRDDKPESVLGTISKKKSGHGFANTGHRFAAAGNKFAKAGNKFAKAGNRFTKACSRFEKALRRKREKCVGM